jgi:hypothetical protein
VCSTWENIGKIYIGKYRNILENIGKYRENIGKYREHI